MVCSKNARIRIIRFPIRKMKTWIELYRYRLKIVDVSAVSGSVGTSSEDPTPFLLRIFSFENTTAPIKKWKRNEIFIS